MHAFNCIAHTATHGCQLQAEFWKSRAASGEVVCVNAFFLCALIQPCFADIPTTAYEAFQDGGAWASSRTRSCVRAPSVCSHRQSSSCTMPSCRFMLPHIATAIHHHLLHTTARAQRLTDSGVDTAFRGKAHSAEQRHKQWTKLLTFVYGVWHASRCAKRMPVPHSDKIDFKVTATHPSGRMDATDTTARMCTHTITHVHSPAMCLSLTGTCV